MTNTAGLSVSMSARPVEAAGAPFAPRSVVYHDAGVALDEILSLRPNHEPVVLRVARFFTGVPGSRSATCPVRAHVDTAPTSRTHVVPALSEVHSMTG